MKAIELPAYRTFMFAVIPQLLRDKTGVYRYQDAIAEAERLWNAIDDHVLEAAKKAQK